MSPSYHHPAVLGRVGEPFMWQQGPDSSENECNAQHEDISFQRPENTRKVTTDGYDKEELGNTKYMPPPPPLFKGCPEPSGTPSDLTGHTCSVCQPKGCFAVPSASRSARPSLTLGKALSSYPFSFISFPACRVRV